MVCSASTKELLSDLVSIDSVNPGLVEGAAGESEIARFIAAWLTERQIQVDLIESADSPGRPSVVASLHGEGPMLMFNGHIDTVGVEGMVDPHTPRIDSGVLYGRGAYDMKAGVAAAMLALVDLRTEGFTGNVCLSAVADEEDRSNGTLKVLETIRPDAVVVTEPTDLSPSVAHMGFVWAKVTTLGRSAHGSRRDLGDDAVVRMGEVLQRVAQLDAEIARRPAHELLGNGVLHAGTIRGGEGYSTFPGSCELQLERRTLPGETPSDIEAELESLIAGMGDKARVEVTLVRPAFGTEPDAPLVHALIKACTKTGDAKPPQGDTPWTDAALFAEAGAQTIVFGPGGFGAHALSEGVYLDDVERCRRTLVELAHLYRGGL